MKRISYLVLTIFMLSFLACQNEQDANEAEAPTLTGGEATSVSGIDALLNKYATVRLTADLSGLTDQQKKMIGLLIEAARTMDDLFWYEAYGDKEELMAALPDDRYRRFASINYGPWDRLADNEPFVERAGPKPPGANFYPQDMTKAEFEAADLPDKASLYTFLRRDEAGKLMTVPYHEEFKEEVTRVADLLRQASELAEDPGLKKYLALRGAALLDDNYQPSDLAWMDMKNNEIDVVIGPIETYEDKLFGYKAAHECYVLIKDMDWSRRLAKYADFLPELQRGLPVPG